MPLSVYSSSRPSTIKIVYSIILVFLSEKFSLNSYFQISTTHFDFRFFLFIRRGVDLELHQRRSLDLDLQQAGQARGGTQGGVGQQPGQARGGVGQHGGQANNSVQLNQNMVSRYIIFNNFLTNFYFINNAPLAAMDFAKFQEISLKPP